MSFPGRGWAAVVLAALFTLVLLRTAWISDDAYITLRVVDNLLQGHGPVWNVGERVQVYTHPLWFFVLSVATLLSREFYLTTILVSMFFSLVAFGLVTVGLARSTAGVVSAGLVLLLSPAFIDYSTSGLENPLTFCLLASFAFVVLREAAGPQRSFRLAVLGALLCINRLDLMVLVGPAVAWDAFSRRHVRSTLAGLLPLVGWLLFSLVYYGGLLPNTAHAKLGTGIDRAWYLSQGLRYVFDAVLREPLLSLAILGGMLVSIRADRPVRSLAVGILLYLVYTVWIGGDFMRGRMLTAPMFLAVAVLAHRDLGLPQHGRLRALPALAVVAVGFLAPEPTVLSGPAFGRGTNRHAFQQTWGIADERAVYFRNYGMWNGSPLEERPGRSRDALRVRQSKEVVALKLIESAGVGGFITGPGPYALDEWSLGNPLLARLPAPRGAPRRIGHIPRDIPAGYLLSLQGGTNQIEDAGLRAYHEHIQRITRGPLFTAARWSSIAGMMLGRFEGLLPVTITPLEDSECVELAARDLDTPGPRLLWRAARVHCRAGDFARAEPLLRRLASLDIVYADDYIRPAVNIGFDHLRRDPAFAEELARLLVEIEPEDVDAVYGLGAVLVRTGRREEGIASLRRAAARGSEEAQRALARATGDR